MKLSFIINCLLGITLTNAKLVMLIRNGEKLNNKVSNLSTIGQARADCLVEVFGTNGTYVTPQKIFAKSPEDKSTRPRDTVIPLAKSLNLEIDTSYNNDNMKDLVTNIINSPEEVVLISWANGEIDSIAMEFGVKKAPIWEGDVYDEIWILTNNNEVYVKQSDVQVNEINRINGNNGYDMIVVKENVEQCMKNIIPDFAQLNSGSFTLKANILLTLINAIFIYVVFFF